MLFLPMAFARMTSTMNNAIMTDLIVALGKVIGTIALNVIVKVVFQTISFNYTFSDYILNFDLFKNKLGRSLLIIVVFPGSCISTKFELCSCLKEL